MVLSVLQAVVSYKEACLFLTVLMLARLGNRVNDFYAKKSKKSYFVLKSLTFCPNWSIIDSNKFDKNT